MGAIMAGLRGPSTLPPHASLRTYYLDGGVRLALPILHYLRLLCNQR